MTDPVTLAREVVDDYEHMDDWNKPRTRSGKEVPPSRVTLARAVIAAAELADRLDDEANRVGSRGGAFTARAFAAEIRTALNGETRD